MVSPSPALCVRVCLCACQAELEEGKKKELMAAIQAHFKEWLQATGAMRQVYDLARAERDEAGGSALSGLGSPTTDR